LLKKRFSEKFAISRVCQFLKSIYTPITAQEIYIQFIDPPQYIDNKVYPTFFHPNEEEVVLELLPSIIQILNESTDAEKWSIRRLPFLKYDSSQDVDISDWLPKSNGNLQVAEHIIKLMSSQVETARVVLYRESTMDIDSKSNMKEDDLQSQSSSNYHQHHHHPFSSQGSSSSQGIPSSMAFPFSQSMVYSSQLSQRNRSSLNKSQSKAKKYLGNVQIMSPLSASPLTLSPAAMYLRSRWNDPSMHYSDDVQIYN